MPRTMTHPGLLPQPAAIDMPLHCNICPKKPDFSDVSHLLTHVASKGHLSNYYKMKVKGSSDSHAKKAVDDYDTWYDEWDVQDLMGERMKQKEKKKSGHAPAPAPRKTAFGHSKQKPKTASTRFSSADAASVLSAASTQRAVTIPTSSYPSARYGSRLRESLLNPQLDRPIKIEPPSRSATPASFRSFDTSALQGPYTSSMHHWMGCSYGDLQMDDGSTLSSESGPFDLAYLPAGRTPFRVSNSIHSLLNEDEPDEMETITDAARLKGVFWQGMACFDSATPEMKRKRNQKKSHSVVAQLMATSEIIEPIELVFDASGCLRKERTITGSPDVDDGDESPLSGESSPPPEIQPVKRKRPAPRQPRRALAEKNPNTGRVGRRSNGRLHLYGPSGLSKLTTPFIGVDNDDDLTYADVKPRKRSGFSIHRDETGPDITFNSPPIGYTTYMPATSHACADDEMAELPGYGMSGLSRATGEVAECGILHSSFGTNSYGHSHGHQRAPSYGLGSTFGGTFRPSNHNYASFGRLNNHTLFHHTNVGPHMSFAGQPLGFGLQSIANDLGFPIQPHFHPWENMLASNNHELPNLMGQHVPVADNDTSNVLEVENSGISGMFAHGMHVDPEPATAKEEDDDQATISPPESDHGDR